MLFFAHFRIGQQFSGIHLPEKPISQSQILIVTWKGENLELIMEDFEAYSVDDVHLDENGSQKVSQIILSWCEKNEKSLF